MNYLIKIIIATLSVLISSYLLPGVHVDSFLAAMMVALVLGVLNVILKPILILLSLPAVIFSFGLFLIVINILIILSADYLIAGFKVDGFWWALLFSIVMWLVGSLLNTIKPKGE
jgi:putative membrane protein